MQFPRNPYLGQLLIDHGNLWRWNGISWGVISLKIESPATPVESELTLTALEARITAIEEALNQSFLLTD